MKRITESLDGGDLNPSALYQRVLLHQATLASAVAPLPAPETRQLAYEMALCVCEADDTLNEAEQRFLAELRRELQLDDSTTAAFQQQADALTQTPLITSTAVIPTPPPLQTDSATDAENPAQLLNLVRGNPASDLQT